MEISINDIVKMQKAIKMQMKVINNAIESVLEENKKEPKGVFAQHVEVPPELIQSPKDVEPSNLDGVVINELSEHGGEEVVEPTGLN